MKKKIIIICSLILALLIGTVVIGVISCSNKDEPESQGESASIEVPTLNFAEKEIEMLLGEERQLSLETLFEGETATYTSNDANIVTVDENCLVKGVGVGSTVVKATTSESRTALVKITVHDPESYPVPYIAVNQTRIQLSVGDEYRVNYEYTYLGRELTSAVEVSSENESVVKVNDKVITAISEGEAKVVLRGESSYGTAVTTIIVTVIQEQVEFSLSISGKDIYVGRQVDLVVYVNASSGIQEIADATFEVEDTSVANIDDGVLIPLSGGDTTVEATFTYGGVEKCFSLPIHVYGLNTCTVKLQDGSIDSQREAFYGDIISLNIKNEEGNPEYRKEVKAWYVDGEKLAGDTFVMPDKDVEVVAKFINETDEDFIDSFSEGHLLNDIQSRVEYVDEVFADKNGVTSDMGGYVKFTSPSWSSLCFNFEEAVLVNDYATVSLRLYLPDASEIVYFGYASGENFNSQNNHTRRYEIGRSKSGDVPHQTVIYEEWIVVELPLSAFKEVGEKLSGISISVSSNSYIYIDYISVNYGLAATDPIYQEGVLYNAIIEQENASQAQVEAIANYYSWSQSLTAEQRNSTLHQQNVNAIKEIMNTHFSSKIVLKDSNIPKVSGDVNYTGDQKGTANCHTEHKSPEYDNYYMTQFNKGTFDGKFTLNAFKYDNYGEVSFGLFAITGGNGTITIGDGSTSFNASKAHYYRIVVSGGVLTAYDDSLDNADGGGVVFTANLSQEVLNGTTGLVIDFTFTAWSQAEITEAYMTIEVDDII